MRSGSKGSSPKRNPAPTGGVVGKKTPTTAKRAGMKGMDNNDGMNHPIGPKRKMMGHHKW